MDRQTGTDALRYEGPSFLTGSFRRAPKSPGVTEGLCFVYAAKVRPMALNAVGRRRGGRRGRVPPRFAWAAVVRSTEVSPIARLWETLPTRPVTGAMCQTKAR